MNPLLLLLAASSTTEEAHSDFHETTRKILNGCLIGLGNICFDNFKNMELFYDLNGCETVLSILSAVTSVDGYSKICEYSLSVLGNISHLPANKVKITNLDGCKVILDVIENHPKNELVFITIFFFYTCIIIIIFIYYIYVCVCFYFFLGIVIWQQVII